MSAHDSESNSAPAAGQDAQAPAVEVEPPTPQSLSRMANSSLHMSLANLTSGPYDSNEPLSFSWDADVLDPALLPSETQSQPSADQLLQMFGIGNGQSGHSDASRRSSSNDISDVSGEQAQSLGSEEFVVPLVPPADHVVKGPRLTSTGRLSHAKKVPDNHVKRPRNSFILFRSHVCLHNLVPPQMGINDHRQISRIVGNMWKNLPAEEKRVWEEMAEKEKEEHRRNNPNYKYKPTYKNATFAKKRRQKPVIDEDVEAEERKCLVVARVLLEGGEVNDEELNRKVEEQKERDEIEGRHRGKKLRMPSRSRSASLRGVENQRYRSTSSDIRAPRPQESNQWLNNDFNQLSYEPSSYDDRFGLGDYHWQSAPQASQDLGPAPVVFGRRSPPASLSLSNFQLSNQTGNNAHTPRTLAMQDFTSQFNSHSMPNFFSPRAADFNLRHEEPISPNRLASLLSMPSHSNSMDSNIFNSLHLDNSSRPADQSFSNAGINSLLSNDSYGQQPFSHLGEMAASSAQQNQMSYQPDADVQYVYLSREQAADAALVQQLRSQGYGVTFEP